MIFRDFVFRTLVVAGAVLAQAVLAHAADVSGTYSVRGVNPDGSVYTGTAELKRVKGELFNIRWSLGENVDTGVCIVGDDTMSCGYRRVGSSTKKAGVAIYTINASGKFVGRWADEDFTKVAKETLTRSR